MASNLGDGRDSSGFQGVKKPTGSVYPERAIDAGAGVERIEPMITGKLLKSRFLFGIPLKSPVTKEELKIEDLDDYIKRGVNQFEIDAQVEVSPVIRRHRSPFDPNLYHSNIFTEVPNKPIQKVIRLAICSASYRDTEEEGKQYPSGAEIYRIPNEWVDMSYATRGTLFVNPINPAFSAIGTNTAVAASGATILQFIGQQGWVPAYWTLESVHGFCSEDGNVPVIVNECVGQRAAMLVLDNLIPLFRIVSHSLGIDGMSQSQSDQLQQLLQLKRKQLDDDYKANVRRIKTLTGNKFFSSNV